MLFITSSEKNKLLRIWAPFKHKTTPTFRLSGLRLGTHLCRDGGRLWIWVWVKNTTFMPISAAAVTEAKSSTERLRLWSPTTRVLQVVGDGVITLTSFFKSDCDINVRKTSDKISAMCHNPTINALLTKNDALAQASRVCLHGARWCSCYCSPDATHCVHCNVPLGPHGSYFY